jgi:hypothetical protein
VDIDIDTVANIDFDANIGIEITNIDIDANIEIETES